MSTQVTQPSSAPEYTEVQFVPHCNLERTTRETIKQLWSECAFCSGKDADWPYANKGEHQVFVAQHNGSLIMAHKICVIASVRFHITFSDNKTAAYFGGQSTLIRTAKQINRAQNRAIDCIKALFQGDQEIQHSMTRLSDINKRLPNMKILLRFSRKLGVQGKKYRTKAVIRSSILEAEKQILDEIFVEATKDLLSKKIPKSLKSHTIFRFA